VKVNITASQNSSKLITIWLSCGRKQVDFSLEQEEEDIYWAQTVQHTSIQMTK